MHLFQTSNCSSVQQSTTALQSTTPHHRRPSTMPSLDFPVVVTSHHDWSRAGTKVASDHRCALTAAHLSYFQSLKDTGDALRKFIDEEIIMGSAGGDSSSVPGSPVLTLPSGEGKRRKPKSKLQSDNKLNNSSSPALISHLNSPGDEELEDSSFI